MYLSHHLGRFGRMFLFVAVAALSCPAPAISAESIAVIAHPRVHEAELSGNALRSIFGMRLRKWPDGAPVRVFVLPDQNPVHALFCKTRLQTYPHQIRRAWDRLVYSGTGQAPIEVQTEEEMLARVSSTPGAIGYLPESVLSNRGGEVHVLTIE